MWENEWIDTILYIKHLLLNYHIYQICCWKYRKNLLYSILCYITKSFLVYPKGPTAIVSSKRSRWCKCNFFFQFRLLYVWFLPQILERPLHNASSLICASSFLRQFPTRFFSSFIKRLKKYTKYIGVL